MARFYIITGEKSGDNLGAFVGEGLLKKGHDVAGWGGDKMRAAGISIDQDIATLKVMGWSDVIIHIFKLRQLLLQCRKDIEKNRPDTLVLIDFGSFNLRMAIWAKRLGLRVVYYSPPKVWASRSGRIHDLKKYCDEIIVLFPFEQAFFHSHHMDVHYFGHPLSDYVRDFQSDPQFKERHGISGHPVLAIIPGSRKAEIKKTLPVYLKSTKMLPEYNVCVSVAEGMETLVRSLVRHDKKVTLVNSEDYYNLLAHADKALITSGTATFEACLFKIPHVIGYKTDWLNYQVAKRLIKTQYIGLPNLIAGKSIVPELIQNDLNQDNITENLIRLCRPSAKSMLANSFHGIINEINLDNCLFNTIATITGEKT